MLRNGFSSVVLASEDHLGSFSSTAPKKTKQNDSLGYWLDLEDNLGLSFWTTGSQQVLEKQGSA